jgi:hypothetical protein
MNGQKDLHLRRLHESLEAIQQFRDGRINAADPRFRLWQQRTLQSLRELFGEDHQYVSRFLSLQFRNLHHRVATLRPGGGLVPGWSQEDQTIFENGLQFAHAILSDALEEFSILATQAQPAATSMPSKQPQVVVNVTNVLSQSTHVELSQVISNLDSLGLLPDQLAQAKKHAEELAEEAHGEQRWPILAKSLEKLKSMGKSVYENVALPLLLEMLKKQTGLNG